MSVTRCGGTPSARRRSAEAPSAAATSSRGQACRISPGQRL
ncbi:hypothetical protein SOM08_06390 [Hydrogenophaga sp. SNF1]|nr:hypothetical protein [Hydrogenophaga sp. SNF1]WQB84939.1 hypothetical protein SOM08_06390 [Hydrogenophaga sp. SNF1]